MSSPVITRELVLIISGASSSWLVNQRMAATETICTRVIVSWFASTPKLNIWTEIFAVDTAKDVDVAGLHCLQIDGTREQQKANLRFFLHFIECCCQLPVASICDLCSSDYYNMETTANCNGTCCK